jgi:hypothetical protein
MSSKRRGRDHSPPKRRGRDDSPWSPRRRSQRRRSASPRRRQADPKEVKRRKRSRSKKPKKSAREEDEEEKRRRASFSRQRREDKYWYLFSEERELDSPEQWKLINERKKWEAEEEGENEAAEPGQVQPVEVGPKSPKLERQGEQPPISVPVPKQQTIRGKVLHLFSGKSNRSSTLAGVLRTLGWACLDVDKLNDGPHQNLLDDTTFEHWKTRIERGEFDFVFVGMPCETYSRVRHVRPGPEPLRSWDEPMGITGLRKELNDQVREANLLTGRAVDLCWYAAKAGAGFAIENPPEYREGPSLWDMRKVKELKKKFKCKLVAFDQCMFGAEATKHTVIMFHKGAFETLQCRCNHPMKDWSGYDERGPIRVTAAHEPAHGRRGDGQWYTKKLAEYPPALNKRIAACIAISKGPAEEAAAAAAAVAKAEPGQ